jgi:hypothetical protein
VLDLPAENGQKPELSAQCVQLRRVKQAKQCDAPEQLFGLVPVRSQIHIVKLKSDFRDDRQLLWYTEPR